MEISETTFLMPEDGEGLLSVSCNRLRDDLQLAHLLPDCVSDLLPRRGEMSYKSRNERGWTAEEAAAVAGLLRNAADFLRRKAPGVVLSGTSETMRRNATQLDLLAERWDALQPVPSDLDLIEEYAHQREKYYRRQWANGGRGPYFPSFSEWKSSRESESESESPRTPNPFAHRLRKIISPDGDFELRNPDEAAEIFLDNGYQWWDLYKLLKDMEAS